MKKALAFVLALAALLCALTACAPKQSAQSTTESNASTTGTDSPIVIRIGHAQNEDGDWHKSLEVFKERVETLSEGSIKVELYANETLGAEMDNITAIQQGNCEGVLSGDTMSNWTPYAALLAMPYAASSMDSLIEIASSEEIGGVIEEQIRQNVKLHPIGFFIRSARNLTANKKIESIDDLKGLKVRVPNNPLHISLWNAFGASATPLAWGEVFSALQNGTIEALSDTRNSSASALPPTSL